MKCKGELEKMHLIYNKQKLKVTDQQMRDFAHKLFAEDISKGSKEFYYIDNGTELELCRPCETTGETLGFSVIYIERDWLDGKLIEIRVKHLPTGTLQIARQIEKIAHKIFVEEKLNKEVNKEFKKLLIRSKELGFH